MAGRRSVNLSFDAELIDEARRYGINLSRLLEGKLRDVLREERQRRWLAANRSALEDFDRYLDEHGVFGEEWRNL